MAKAVINSSYAIDRVKEISAAFAGRQGAILPLLHAIQDDLGDIDDAAVPIVATALNLSRAKSCLTRQA